MLEQRRRAGKVVRYGRLGPLDCLDLGAQAIRKKSAATL